MKPAPFDYVRARSVDEACQLLASDDDARLIAGGQTLVPMMAMRLARPSKLIDIGRLDDINGISDGPSYVQIGGTTRQIAAERSGLIKQKLPLLSAVMPWVGHPPTRSRGTFGGSVANADPAAEVPLVLATLGGSIVTRNIDGECETPAAAFFLGPMTTIAAAGDCITELRFPVWSQSRVGVGFHEVASRRSDFALVAAAAQVALDEDGRCCALAVGVGGATPIPTALTSIGEALVGSDLSAQRIDDAVSGGIEALEIMTDPHASPTYRRRAAGALVKKAIMDAIAGAKGAVA